MATPFTLEIITPERQFFKGEVESVSFPTTNGRIEIMAHHIPMVAALEVGVLRIRTGEEVREAFSSEGFLEVRPDETLLFVQACEWPEEIDLRRAKEAKRRVEERLARERSAHDRASLARALARLQLGQRRNNPNM